MAEEPHTDINRSDTTNFGNRAAENNDANQENRRLVGTPLEDTELTPINRIRQMAFPLNADPKAAPENDFNRLLRAVGEARFVLIGEASHGTYEFYQARAEITKRLILEHGFKAVAVEADWPDAYRVNRWVQGRGAPDASSQGALDALTNFQRFPLWMWRNQVVFDFITWLRSYNDARAATDRTGFYGLDLYSLYSSIEAVVTYLERVDPEAAKRARYRYSCFDQFGEDPQTYGYAASFSLTPTCQKEVLEQLQELRRQSLEQVRKDGFVSNDEFFYAEQNARIVKNSEAYYRAMFEEGAAGWNLRDSHMMETLEALVQHLEPRHPQPKVVVWAHNSHLGDARATEMAQLGELNLGQLVRERFGREVFSIGFTTHHGTVTAADDWGGPARNKTVRPALPNSFERLFHAVDLPAFALLLTGMEAKLLELREERLERAIGVVYRPQTERISHYFSARLMDQFDAVIHYDESQAVEPLDRTPEWDRPEM